ncbi:MAG: CCA tRNA nucleotidyltransferase [Candidatus Aenigmarchaeota archaeon]|nr:CCA tRNA nucleotidyltransferase [Candidatus Aenigmarchaeota archaeon]
MSLEGIKKLVLGKIKPSKKEELAVNTITHRTMDILEDMGHEAVVVGSTGKHTWLSGDYDIDIFILFPKDMPREELEKKGLTIGKEIAKRLKGKSFVKYAEHPYTQIHTNKFAIDIVPCYKIEKGEKIISAVDRSPLHLKYVIEKLSPDQRDEVRLLKQFMKGVGVYGSDVKHLGFSGYVCELLVIKYGSFENVLKEIDKWAVPQIVDMDQHFVKSLQGALFMSDPIDPQRNVSAAVNSESLIKLISDSRKFLRKQSGDIFFEKIYKLSASQISLVKKRETYFLALESKRPDVINDTLFPQLRKTLCRLENLLKEDFSVLHSIEYADNKSTFLIFELASSSLPAIKQMVGPPIQSKLHTSEFLSKYRQADFGPYIIENKWVAEVKRKYRKPEDLVKDFLNQPEDKLIEKGIPKHVVSAIKSSKILSGKSFWKITKNKTLSDFLRKKYFEGIEL